MKRYQAILTSNTKQDQITNCFDTIMECRLWAESFGANMDVCCIKTNGKKPKVVAWHRRATGLYWFRAI